MLQMEDSLNLTNEGCESSISSWDSEPEVDLPSLISSNGMVEGSLQSNNLEENYVDMEEQNQFVGVENTDDGLLWEMDNRSYEELLKKFLEKEEELRISNFRLNCSKQEIIKLKVQVKNSDDQLYNMSKELKLKEEELHKQKGLSKKDIFDLKFEIAQSARVLEDLVIKYENNEINHKQEVQKLKSELLDSQAKFSLDIIASLCEMKIQLTSKLEDYESKNKELENKLRLYEAEKLKQEELQATQQMDLQYEIKSLREKLCQGADDREAVNKELEMVRNELDEANVKIHNLNAEICSRDDKISNIKKYKDLKASMKKLMVEYNTKFNEVNKLKLLEKEVTRLNGVISDMAAKKVSAIRQLHCSVEYYKSGYHELLDELYEKASRRSRYSRGGSGYHEFLDEFDEKASRRYYEFFVGSD